MSGMFNICSSLATLNLSNFNVSSVTNKSDIFYSISSSVQISVSNNEMKQWVIDASTNPKLTNANDSSLLKGENFLISVKIKNV